MKINWDSTYSVGVKTIDEQHKRIVDIINQLIEDSHLYVHSERISEMLGQLRVYAREHFKDEESLLKKHKFHNIDLHKEEHMEFRLRLLELCQDTMNEKGSVPQELLTFVRNWWFDHILLSDMEFKSFLTERGVN